jgi:hypothetical protein
MGAGMKRALLTLCMLPALAGAQTPAPPDLLTISGNSYELLFQDDAQTRAIGLMIFAKRLGAESDAKNPHFICWPAGSTYLQASKVIDMYMVNNPQFLNYSMHDIAAAALMTAFPCRQ